MTITDYENIPDLKKLFVDTVETRLHIPYRTLMYKLHKGSWKGLEIENLPPTIEKFRQLAIENINAKADELLKSIN